MLVLLATGEITHGSNDRKESIRHTLKPETAPRSTITNLHAAVSGTKKGDYNPVLSGSVNKAKGPLSQRENREQVR